MCDTCENANEMRERLRHQEEHFLSSWGFSPSLNDDTGNLEIEPPEFASAELISNARSFAALSDQMDRILVEMDRQKEEVCKAIFDRMEKQLNQTRR